MVSQFGGVRSILESGIPPMRNKQSAHGQGPKVVPVPKTHGAIRIKSNWGKYNTFGGFREQYAIDYYEHDDP